MALPGFEYGRSVFRLPKRHFASFRSVISWNSTCMMGNQMESTVSLYPQESDCLLVRRQYLPEVHARRLIGVDRQLRCHASLDAAARVYANEFFACGRKVSQPCCSLDHFSIRVNEKMASLDACISPPTVSRFWGPLGLLRSHLFGEVLRTTWRGSQSQPSSVLSGSPAPLGTPTILV
jgi:hypothetical protein